MLVDFPCTGKLCFAKPVDADRRARPRGGRTAVESAEPSRTRVVCDWVQYRNSFHDVVDIRPVLAVDDGAIVLTPVPPAAGVADDDREVAIYVRRCGRLPHTELDEHQPRLPGDSTAARRGDRVSIDFINWESGRASLRDPTAIGKPCHLRVSILHLPRN